MIETEISYRVYVVRRGGINSVRVESYGSREETWYWRIGDFVDRVYG